MRPIKCDVCKKFYDADKYDVCPHCKSETSDGLITSEPVIEIRDDVEKSRSIRKGLFSKFNKNNTERQGEINNGQNNDIEIHSHSADYMFSEQPIKEEEPVEILNEKAVEKAVEETISTMPIAEAIKQANAVNKATDVKTVAYYNFSNDIEPVVGWLVCIKGEYKGESFNLKTGRNSIGRALTMEVALAQEKSVSRERHAVITFDPQQNKFFVQSGDSRGLTYVNKELLMTFKELEKGDIIALGSCELMFFPLCGEEFSWDSFE